jgi:WS/DGAT/MGAT family acyltransferase
MRDGAGVDRLSGPELSSFVPETRGWPADIGVIAILEGAGLFDGGGRLRLTGVRDAITGRLHQAPRLRQVVYRPGPGLGRPLWIDAPCFDIADHVRIRKLPATADQADLLQACEELRQHRLDQSRPLWQLWLLPGLSGGQVGMFFRAHHAIADGPAAVTLLGALLDCAPGTTAPVAPPWRPRPAPAAGDLLVDNLGRCVSALAGAASHLAHPAAAAARLRGTWPAIREPLAGRRAPRTSLNQPIGATRRIAIVGSRLDPVKDAAHRAGGTVNDAVLAAVAGGLRDLLQSRAENVTGLVLRAMVPVSLHDPALGPAQGNQYGVMMVPLPVGEPSSARRLQAIAAQTTWRKKQSRRAWGTGLAGSPLVQRLAVRVAGRQHVIHIHVANVPGPASPLYLAGARLAEAFPVVPLSGNVTLGIGVLSYAGQLNITVIADRDTCPDLPVFTTGLTRSLAGLTGAAMPATPPTGGNPAR